MSSILAREGLEECCDSPGDGLGEMVGSCLAREGGQPRPSVRLSKQPRVDEICAIIEPCELPRAAIAQPEPEPEMVYGEQLQSRTDVAVHYQPQAAESVCVTSEDRRANDLRRSEIQSTSYLVVDNVRSTMTGGQSALAGLDSFAMLECYAPASLIIDEWGVDRNSLAPAPPLNSVSGKPLNIVGIWRNAEFALGEGHGIFRCNVTVGEMAISTVQMLFGIGVRSVYART